MTWGFNDVGVSGAFLERAESVDLDWEGRQFFEYEICTQGFSRNADVAVWNQDHRHASGPGRSHVGAGVTDHDALVGGDTQFFHDGLQGQGVWFLLRCRITANYAGERAMDVQCVQDFFCHTLWFVGAKTLLNARIVKVIKHMAGRW